MTKDNHLLGEFNLDNLPKGPRGVPQIEITFEVDENGILEVSAEEKSANTSNKISITSDRQKLTADEIEQMLADAEEFKEADKVAKELIDAKNSLESYIFSIRNQIQDPEKLKGKIDEDEKATLEDALKEA